jgi:hypothetical protein
MERDDAFRAALQEEWRAALDDAGFEEHHAKLWLCTGYGEDSEGPVAAYYKPWLNIEDDRFLSPAQRADAEADVNRPLQRIVIFEDFDFANDQLGNTLVPVMGAMLRHELEHARQQQSCGDEVLDIDDQFLDRAIRLKVGGLSGGAGLYNVKPMEQDANAAAAMYLRARHPQHVDAILEGPCGHVARSNTPPEALDSLLARTVACLYQFRDVVVADRDPTIEFAKRLAVYDPRAGALWRQLEEASGFDLSS